MSLINIAEHFEIGDFMYMLNEKTKKNIEKKIGLQFKEIVDSDVDILTKVIEKKAKKKFGFLKTNDSRLLGRGSVYVFLNRLIDLDKIERKLNKI